MKYAILILAFVGLAILSPSFAQDNSRNGDNYQRDRFNNNNRDRNSRRFDRNGGDTGRYDRTRPDDRTRSDRTRETVTASAVAPIRAPASVDAAAEPEPDPMPIENVSTNAGPVDPRSLEAFRLIATRNIFDPNRYPGSTRGPDRPSPPPKRTELFTLVGSISYDKGDFAFFDGSSSDYKKTVKPGDTFAGYKVAQVTPDKVTLESGDKKIELSVGGQMKRQGDEEWKVNSQSEPFGSMSSSGSSGASSTNSSDSSGNGEMPDALKRLLEQRKNEK